MIQSVSEGKSRQVTNPLLIKKKSSTLIEYQDDPNGPMANSTNKQTTGTGKKDKTGIIFIEQ